MARGYRITGHRLSASYSAAKLLWVRDNEPEVYEKTGKMLNAKDYIVFRLTGEFATDYSDASGTNLLDIEKKRSGRTRCCAPWTSPRACCRRCTAPATSSAA